jgi:hypothetical protein
MPVRPDPARLAPCLGELDGDLDEQGRALAAADEAAGDEVFYPADPRTLAAEAAEAAAMPGPSTTGYYDEVTAARAAEAGRCPMVPQRRRTTRRRCLARGRR